MIISKFSACNPGSPFTSEEKGMDEMEKRGEEPEWVGTGEKRESYKTGWGNGLGQDRVGQGKGTRLKGRGTGRDGAYG
jgi:hypothetical protein